MGAIQRGDTLPHPHRRLNTYSEEEERKEREVEKERKKERKGANEKEIVSVKKQFDVVSEVLRAFFSFFFLKGGESISNVKV